MRCLFIDEMNKDAKSGKKERKYTHFATSRTYIYTSSLYILQQQKIGRKGNNEAKPVFFYLQKQSKSAFQKMSKKNLFTFMSCLAVDNMNKKIEKSFPALNHSAHH